MTQAPPLGCAVFAKPTSLSDGGWASLAGQPAFRFTTLDSLASTGATWITSVPESVFLAERGNAYPFLRNGNFLSTPIRALATEIGPGDDSNTEVVTERLGEILNRVVGMATSLCGGRDLVNAVHAGQRASLPAAVHVAMAPQGRVESVPEDLAAVFATLFKPLPPLGAPTAQEVVLRVPANRIELAKIVTSTAVPTGSWLEVPARSLGEPVDLRALINQSKPMMCLVTVRGVLPRVRALAPLTRHVTQGASRWIALPELVALAQMVDVVVRKVYVASDVVPVAATLRVPPPAFGPAGYGSISAGLLAEAYLHAACMQPLVGAAAAEPGDLPGGSLRAAWLTAITRAHMLQEAMGLSEAGFAVAGIGESYLLVAVAKRNLLALCKAVAGSRLLSFPTGVRWKDDLGVNLAQRAEAAMEHGVG